MNDPVVGITFRLTYPHLTHRHSILLHSYVQYLPYFLHSYSCTNLQYCHSHYSRPSLHHYSTEKVTIPDITIHNNNNNNNHETPTTTTNNNTEVSISYTVTDFTIKNPYFCILDPYNNKQRQCQRSYCSKK